MQSGRRGRYGAFCARIYRLIVVRIARLRFASQIRGNRYVCLLYTSEYYGKEKLQSKKDNEDRERYVVLTPDQYDDHEIIALMSRTPTFNRDSHIKELIREAATTLRQELSLIHI